MGENPAGLSLCHEGGEADAEKTEASVWISRMPEADG